MDRQEGYYWCFNKKTTIWHIMEWCDGSWWRFGWEDPFSQDDFEVEFELGPQIVKDGATCQ